MKAAITFIVLGALLIMTPALSDHLYWQSVQTLISKGPVNGGTMYGYFSARWGIITSLAFGRRAQRWSVLLFSSCDPEKLNKTAPTN